MEVCGSNSQFHGAEVVRAYLVAVFAVLFRSECLHCIALMVRNDILLDLEDVNHESDRFDDHGEHLRYSTDRDKIRGWLAWSKTIESWQ